MNTVGTDIFSEPTARVFDKIVEIEIAHAAHDFKIDDIYPWSALRSAIYDRILVATGVVERFSDLEKSGFRDLPGIFANLFYRNPFFRSPRARNLIVPWTRTQNVEGRSADILSSRLCRYLPSSEVARLDLNRGLSTLDWSAFSVDALSFLGKFGERAAPVTLSYEATAKINALDDALYQAFRVRLRLISWFASFVAYFSARRKATVRLLRRAGVENVFVVVSYGHPVLIAAARDVGARVIELQHGLISRYHIGYDFPDGMTPAYAPDVTLTFGDFWNRAARFAPNTRRITFGAPHVRGYLDKIDRDSSKRAELLFISQPGIGNQLLEFALRVAGAEGAPKVIYRLHPREDENRARKTVIEANISADRLEISAGGGGARTLAIQSSVRAQAGVYSTAVVEGLACGCQTFLIPLPGSAALASLVVEGYAKVVNSPADLVAQFASTASQGLRQIQTDEFFAMERPGAIAEAMARIKRNDRSNRSLN